MHNEHCHPLNTRRYFQLGCGPASYSIHQARLFKRFFRKVNAVVFRYVKHNLCHGPHALGQGTGPGDMPWIGNQTLSRWHADYEPCPDLDRLDLLPGLAARWEQELHEPTHSRVGWGQQTTMTGNQDASDTFRPGKGGGSNVSRSWKCTIPLLIHCNCRRQNVSYVQLYLRTHFS